MSLKLLHCYKPERCTIMRVTYQVDLDHHAVILEIRGKRVRTRVVT